jgi:predicted histone-like DNA-binding protein
MKTRMMKKAGGEILFDFYSVPNPNDENDVRYCVRPVTQRVVSVDDLASQIEKECTLTEADVKAVIAALSNNIASRLAGGERVYLPQLGYFNIKLKCDKKIDPKKTKANHISFDTVIFQPDKAFKSQVVGMKFRRCPLRHTKRPDEADILSALKACFNSKNAYITRSFFESTFGVSRATALRIINDLLKAGKLVNTNTKHNPVYSRGEKL